MSAKTFADFKPSSGRPHGCLVCGEETAGVVNVTLRKRQVRGLNGVGPQLASRQVSLCEQHAVELFEKAHALFPKPHRDGS